jgi:DNA-binding SARP family transcriptional activator
VVQFRILGPLEVAEQDALRALGGSKQRAVLAILLLHRGAVVSSERLIDELWGERPPVTAAKTLQGYISRLRKTLDEDVLHTRGHGYVLTPAPGQLDLDLFERLAGEGREALSAGDSATAAERLRSALALWRGSPLADLAYEPFAQVEIARLQEVRLATLEDRIEADLGLGRHGQLVAELEALVREQPLRERVRGQLMLALYRSGRQAEALEVYGETRRALIEELGLEPRRELQDLETAVLRHDPVLDPPASPIAATRPAEVGDARQLRGGDGVHREPLVGREEQVDQLHSGLDAAFHGRGRLLMIGGEAGIGKTRLADELARDARDFGARVVWGRCWEAGGAPAYWPWVQVLRSLLHDRDNLDLRSFGGAGASSLLALIPELGESSPRPGSPVSESEGARFQLFDAVAWLLRESGDMQHLVVILDDLHAADTPSLLLLQFLAGQLEGARLLLVGLYRDDDPGEDGILSSCLAALAREQSTRRMRLTGLSVGDTAALIVAMTGRELADNVARTIQAETEGNPLFVGEIVRLLEAEGKLERPRDEHRGGRKLPDTVKEVIGQRLRRLAPESRRLLCAASTLGREFGVRELAAVSGIDEDAVLETFDEAITARVLVEASSVDRLRFSHALVRDALYEELGAADRRAAHLRAGEILEGFYSFNPEPHLAELAHHFFEALPSGDPTRAVAFAQRAGDHAIALLAYEEAARLFALALRALDLQAGDVNENRCTLLVALGDARARAGDEPAAREAFLEAGAIAARAGLPVHQARAALGYGGRFVWSRASNDAHVIPSLEAALQALPADASSLQVRLMARLSGALRDHPSRERRASLSAQAVETARGLGDPATLAYVLDGHYSAIWGPETSDERLAIADEIIDLALKVADDERAIQGRFYRVSSKMELGRMSEAETELDIVGEKAAALRQPAQLWITAATRANLALFQGRFDEAQALIADALTLGQLAQRRDAVLSQRLQLFVLQREVGIDSEIESLINDAVSEFPTRPVFRCALAYIHADLGDASRAKAAVDDLAAQAFAAIRQDNEYLFSLAFLADAVDTLGDVRAATVLYDLLVPHAHLNAINSDEVATGSVSRTLGVLARALSRSDAAARHFDAAIVHNRDMGARPWTAHAQHDYGRMLLERDAPDDRDSAHQLLSAAAQEFETLGMTPWLERAAQLLAVV